jgi:hypothetical protein
VNAEEPQPGWMRLLRIARALIRQVNADQELIDHWTLGGGTALMLQIDHRESHDIDIFMHDPQLLTFLDPQKRDFNFESVPYDATGDGSKFLKFGFEAIGEIDFIVAGAMTTSPTEEFIFEGQAILLDSICEVITKKIRYRGASIKPRDIFDIAAASDQHGESIIHELKSHRDEVAQALATLDKLNPAFVSSAIAQLVIKERYVEIAKTSFERAKQLLQAAI